MKNLKIKWSVSEVPTSQFRSFERRGWPSADYSNGTFCASILCEDEYVPRNIKTGNHAPLRLRIANHSKTPWKGISSKSTFKTLKDAKAALLIILKKHDYLIPEEIKNDIN